MFDKFKYSTVLAIVFRAILVASVDEEPWQKCQINPKKDLNNTQVLYLQPNLNKFIYPVKPESFLLEGEDPVLRVGCVNGTVSVRDNVTEWNSALIECLGGKAMKITGTWMFMPLRDIGCTGYGEPISQLTGRKASNGKKLAEIGYQFGLLDFVPVIDEMTVSKVPSGYITRWLHYKISSIQLDNQKSNKEDFQMINGPLSGEINYEKIYDMKAQRDVFVKLFADEELVEKYMPADGTEGFVAGQLVKRDDLYYEVEQDTTSFYETTTPIWKSVDSGNWKLVGETVRLLAQQSLSTIEVWSGTYLSLYLPNIRGKTTYVELPEAHKPAQFLFKYIYDSTNKRGIVFVTVNNPHLQAATKKDLLCDELKACKTRYPEFSNLKSGYTYCCSLTDFQEYAVKLGLPTFNDEISTF